TRGLALSLPFGPLTLRVTGTSPGPTTPPSLARASFRPTGESRPVATDPTPNPLRKPRRERPAGLDASISSDIVAFLRNCPEPIADKQLAAPGSRGFSGKCANYLTPGSPSRKFF